MGYIIPFFAFSVLHVYLVVGDYSRLWCGVEMEDENSNGHSSLNGVVSVIFRVPKSMLWRCFFLLFICLSRPVVISCYKNSESSHADFFLPPFFLGVVRRRFSEGVGAVVDAAELMISLTTSHHIMSCHVMSYEISP
jgi:hypothetical protein